MASLPYLQGTTPATRSRRRLDGARGPASAVLTCCTEERFGAFPDRLYISGKTPTSWEKAVWS